MPKKPEDGWLIHGVHFSPELIQIAAENGICKRTVRYRIKHRNMTAEEAVTRESIRPPVEEPTNPDVKKFKVLAMQKGIPVDVYLNRVYEQNIEPKRAVEMGR